jgi:hypothetical protein
MEDIDIIVDSRQPLIYNKSSSIFRLGLPGTDIITDIDGYSDTVFNNNNMRKTKIINRKIQDYKDPNKNPTFAWTSDKIDMIKLDNNISPRDRFDFADSINYNNNDTINNNQHKLIVKSNNQAVDDLSDNLYTRHINEQESFKIRNDLENKNHKPISSYVLLLNDKKTKLNISENENNDNNFEYYGMFASQIFLGNYDMLAVKAFLYKIISDTIYTINDDLTNINLDDMNNEEKTNLVEKISKSSLKQKFFEDEEELYKLNYYSDDFEDLYSELNTLVELENLKKSIEDDDWQTTENSETNDINSDNSIISSDNDDNKYLKELINYGYDREDIKICNLKITMLGFKSIGKGKNDSTLTDNIVNIQGNIFIRKFKYLILENESRLYRVRQINKENKENIKRDFENKINYYKYKIEENENIMKQREEEKRSMKIIVKSLQGKSITLYVEPWFTVNDVKNYIQNETGQHPRTNKLIFNGKYLEDNKKLSDYNIENNSTIHSYISMYDVDEKKINIQNNNKEINETTSNQEINETISNQENSTPAKKSGWFSGFSKIGGLKKKTIKKKRANKSEKVKRGGKNRRTRKTN